MSKYQQIVVYFVPVTELLLDVRVFNMELSYLSYIEDAKVEIYKDSVLIKTGYTDANGTYKTYLEAGDYVIVLSKEGYNTVTKTETLTRNTELMVNLPTKLSYVGATGLVQLFMGDHVANPIIIAISKTSTKGMRNTSTIISIPSVTII